MGPNPFSPIYNHVTASNIQSVHIVTYPAPYVPTQEIAEHIVAKCLKEKPIKFDGEIWNVRGCTWI